MSTSPRRTWLSGVPRRCARRGQVGTVPHNGSGWRMGLGRDGRSVPCPSVAPTRELSQLRARSGRSARAPADPAPSPNAARHARGTAAKRRPLVSPHGKSDPNGTRWRPTRPPSNARLITQSTILRRCERSRATEIRSGLTVTLLNVVPAKAGTQFLARRYAGSRLRGMTRGSWASRPCARDPA